MNKELEFNKTIKELGNNLTKIDYNNGDISDIGNEVGYILGNLLKNMSEKEINEFIFGFRHGVSLTNGTHSFS